MEVNPLYLLHEVHGACKVLREKCCVEAVVKFIQENKTIAIDKFMFFIDIFSHLTTDNLRYKEICSSGEICALSENL